MVAAVCRGSVMMQGDSEGIRKSTTVTIITLLRMAKTRTALIWGVPVTLILLHQLYRLLLLDVMNIYANQGI